MSKKFIIGDRLKDEWISVLDTEKTTRLTKSTSETPSSRKETRNPSQSAGISCLCYFRSRKVSRFILASNIHLMIFG